VRGCLIVIFRILNSFLSILLSYLFPYSVLSQYQQLLHISNIYGSPELQQDINKETAKYLKHVLRGQTTQKDSSMHTKTAADFAAAAALADEKVALAERLVALLSRTRARLDHDLGKMLVLQGELDPSQLATYSSINGTAGAVTVGAAPIVAAIESMRTNVAPEPVFSQSVSTAGTNKRMPFNVLVFPGC
jgi:hypothetical protein